MAGSVRSGSSAAIRNLAAATGGIRWLSDANAEGLFLKSCYPTELGSLNSFSVIGSLPCAAATLNLENPNRRAFESVKMTDSFAHHFNLRIPL